MEFMKLEKIEIGGVKGKSLSSQVIKIYEEFQDFEKVFGDTAYDVLDEGSDEFPNDFERFKAQIVDLEKRLGAIVCQVGFLFFTILYDTLVLTSPYCMIP